MAGLLHAPFPNVCQECETDLLYYGITFYSCKTLEHYPAPDMVLRHAPPIGGVVGSRLALSDLREALGTIRHPHPAYRPGTEPTAALHARAIFGVIEHCLTQLETLIAMEGTPPTAQTEAPK